MCAVEKLGHEMAWWKTPSTLNKVRIQSVYSGKNWIDSVAVRHNGKTRAFSNFEKADGCAPDDGHRHPCAGSGLAAR